MTGQYIVNLTPQNVLHLQCLILSGLKCHYRLLIQLILNNEWCICYCVCNMSIISYSSHQEIKLIFFAFATSNDQTTWLLLSPPIFPTAFLKKYSSLSATLVKNCADSSSPSSISPTKPSTVSYRSE